MTRYFTGLAIFVAASLAYAPPPAHATSNYGYRKNEYVIIRDGRSPDKRLSVASHGNGELGDEDFHLYLMAEPAHRKIVPLEAIASDDVLDSAAHAYHARWSADSRHVAVLFRSDRHVVAMRLYEIRERRPHLMSGPALLDEVIKGAIVSSEDYDTRSSSTTLSWLSPTRFSLKERRLFQASSRDLARALGAFGQETPDPDTKTVDGDNKPVEWSFVDFSVEAVCEVSGDRYRVVEVKPGGFE